MTGPSPGTPTPAAGATRAPSPLRRDEVRLAQPGVTQRAARLGIGVGGAG